MLGEVEAAFVGIDSIGTWGYRARCADCGWAGPEHLVLAVNTDQRLAVVRMEATQDAVRHLEANCRRR